VDFDAEGSNVFLLKFASQMALDERGLSSTAIANQDEFERWRALTSHR